MVLGARFHEENGIWETVHFLNLANEMVEGIIRDGSRDVLGTVLGTCCNLRCQDSTSSFLFKADAGRDRLDRGVCLPA